MSGGSSPLGFCPGAVATGAPPPARPGAAPGCGERLHVTSSPHWRCRCRQRTRRPGRRQSSRHPRGLHEGEPSRRPNVDWLGFAYLEGVARAAGGRRMQRGRRCGARCGAAGRSRGLGGAGGSRPRGQRGVVLVHRRGQRVKRLQRLRRALPASARALPLPPAGVEPAHFPAPHEPVGFCKPS